MRTFIAISVDPNDYLKIFYHNMLNNLHGLDIKYAGLNNFHITLAFLGETSNEQVCDIKFELDEIRKIGHPIELELHGLGVFKNIQNPQVLWIGMKSNQQLMTLQEKIIEVIEKHNFKTERQFSPHLTMGRIKQIHSGNNLTHFIKTYGDKVFGRFSINNFVFYESTLTSQGPIYKPLGEFSIV
jgi:2'-5' RNA ligase